MLVNAYKLAEAKLNYLMTDILQDNFIFPLIYKRI